MRISFVAALWAVVLIGTSIASRGAMLTNRYSFNEDSGTTAADSVGGQDGTLMNGAFFSGGSVYLSSFGIASSETNGDYVVFPPNLVTGLTAVTIETWYTPTHNSAAFADWNRIWDFWNANAHFFCRSGNATFGLRGDITTTSGTQGLDGPTVPGGVESHVVWTSDPATGAAKIYVNGVQVASTLGFTNAPAGVGPTPNNWLARSKFGADPYLQAGFNEFRIYDGALSPLEVAASYESGADTPSSDYGTVTSINLVVAGSMLLGNSQQASVLAAASGIANPAVDMTGVPGLTYDSSDTGVLTITDEGEITASGLGSATITATYVEGTQTNTSSQLIAVVSAPPVLLHRYSFDGADFVAVDSIGGANGDIQIGAIQSDGRVTLDGTVLSYVSLPPNMISTTTITNDAVTFEAWATFPATNGNFANLFAFGNTVSGAGGNYIFFTPHSGAADYRVIVSSTQPGWTGNGEQGAMIPGNLDYQTNLHIACVLNFGRDLAAIYTNGVLAGFNRSFTRQLSDVINNYSYIGKSLYDVDPVLRGEIDEFRVYTGALSAQQIAASYQSGGPDSTNNAPGTPVNIALDVPATITAGWRAQATAHGNWQNATNVSLVDDLDLSYSSDNTEVLTVSSTGVLTAIKPGTATVTAAYQGNTGTQEVTVVDPPSAELVHRYSFSATSGDLVADSIGSADGHIMIGTNTMAVTNAAWTGTGQLVINTNTTLGAQDTYVDLPDGIISVLTSNVTIETWVTIYNADYWSRIFDFGSLPGGEDIAAEPFLFFARGWHLDWNGGVLEGGGIPTGTQTHLVVLYNDLEDQAKVFIDGAQVAISSVGAAARPLSTINDTNCWLGRSLYSAPITPTWYDPYLQAAYDEFRIYSGLLTAGQITANYAEGPNPGPAGPTLSIILEEADLKLVWPVNATGFAPFEADSLNTSANWTQVEGTPTVVGDYYELSVPVGPTTRFFRLQR